jgi:Winged helix DNA-binding domain
VATLLPALDPTAMGWKRRDWFLGIDRGQIFDSAGNIGPTLWWDGEIVGSWAIGPAGGIRTMPELPPITNTVCPSRLGSPCPGEELVEAAMVP